MAGSVRKRTWESGGVKKTAWLLDYRDVEGKRRFRTFDTKKEAQAALVAIGGEVRDGKHTPLSQTITVREAGELWIAHSADGTRLNGRKLERSTLENYRKHLRLHINPSIGNLKLTDLTAPRLQQFKAELIRKGSEKNPAALAKRVFTSLKGLLKYARVLGNMAHNPAADISLSGRNGRDKRNLKAGESFPSKEEIRAILAAAANYPSASARQKHANCWRPLLVTASFTGMRASELRGLTWDAVDFDKKIINVERRADRWGTMGDPKSAAGHRDIPMAPMVLNTLREWKLACPKGSKNLVFPTTEGNVHRHSNIGYRVWGAVQQAAGVTKADGSPKYNFHLLRHFAASLMIEQGFSAKRLQALLGHSSIQMSMDLYGHLFPSQEDDQAKFAAAERSVIG